MRTIGRKYNGGVRGDWAAECDYCGATWHRSRMVRDASGFLACPDDQDGKDSVTLARENAASAKSMPIIRGKPKR
jgi:hypothetical protein